MCVMTLVQAKAERFSDETLDIRVREVSYHSPDDAEKEKRNSGTVLCVAYTQAYGTGSRRLQQYLPVQSVVKALMADPETAGLVRRTVLRELAEKVAGWVEE